MYKKKTTNMKTTLIIILLLLANTAFSKTGFDNLGTGVGFILNSTTVDKNGDNYKIPSIYEFSILNLNEKNEIKDALKFRIGNGRKADINSILYFYPWNYQFSSHWKSSIAALVGYASIDYTKDRSTFLQVGARGEIIYRNIGYGISLGGEYLTSFNKTGIGGSSLLVSFLMFPKRFE